MKFLEILRQAVQGYVEDCISGNDQEVNEVEGAWEELKLIFNEMPNGIISYQETLFEISTQLNDLREIEGHPVQKLQLSGGRMAVSALASELARKFEHKHNVLFWSWDNSDTTFFEEIDDFITEKTKDL